MAGVPPGFMSVASCLTSWANQSQQKVGHQKKLWNRDEGRGKGPGRYKKKRGFLLPNSSRLIFNSLYSSDGFPKTIGMLARSAKRNPFPKRKKSSIPRNLIRRRKIRNLFCQNERQMARIQKRFWTGNYMVLCNRYKPVLIFIRLSILSVHHGDCISLPIELETSLLPIHLVIPTPSKAEKPRSWSAAHIRFFSLPARMIHIGEAALDILLS